MPYVIELLGAPGSGKSTMIPFVEAAVRSAGATPRTPVEIARDLATRGPFGALVSRLPDSLRRRLLWATYLTEASLTGTWLALTHPALRTIVAGQRSRPHDAMVRERGVVRWLIRHAGTERMFRRRARPGEVLVVDEGYVHRVVQLFASPVEVPSIDDVRTYLEAVPLPDVVVVVGCPSDACVDRIERRGVWDRFGTRPVADLRRFVEHAAAGVALAADAVVASGVPVLRVENTRSVAESGAAVTAAIAGQLNGRRHWRFSGGASVRRPGTVVAAVRRKARGVPLPESTATEIVRVVGLAEPVSVTSFPGGRRSAIVRVDTPSGPVAVKRYAHDWPVESILHEHEVLSRLETLSFPSARLLRAADGTTVVNVDGSSHAVFEFIDGRSFGGRHLSDGDLRNLFDDLGRLLAELHDTLDGFQPAHRHHLGLDPATGEGLRPLEWHLERFAAMKCVGEGDDREWLAARADDLAGLLAEVDGSLRRRPPSTSIIHGDYGAHNVLVGERGPVLHDFELARTEWRLTEVVMLVSRLRSEVAKRQFVDSYRSAGRISDQEWGQLVPVWRHTALTGAARAWDMWVERGDRSRLALARRRSAAALTAGEAARWAS